MKNLFFSIAKPREMASLRILQSRYGCFRVPVLRLSDFNRNFVKREIIPSCSSSFNSQSQLNAAPDENTGSLRAADQEVRNKYLMNKNRHMVKPRWAEAKNYEELKILIRRHPWYSQTTFQLVRCVIVINVNNWIYPGFDLERSTFLSSPEYHKLMIMLEDELHTLSHQQLLYVMRNYKGLNIDLSSALIVKLLNLLNETMHKCSYIQKLQLCIFVRRDELWELEVARSIYSKCISALSKSFSFDKENSNKGTINSLGYHCSCRTTHNGVRCELLKYLLENVLPEFPFLYYLFKGIEISGKSGREKLGRDLKIAVKSLKKGLEKVKLSEKLDVRIFLKTIHYYIRGVISEYYEYDEELCELISNLIIDLNLNIKAVIQLFALMCDMGHINMNVIKHIHCKLCGSLKYLEPGSLVSIPIVSSVIDCFGRKIGADPETYKDHLESASLGENPLLLLPANVAMASQGWLWKRLDEMFNLIATEYKSNNLAEYEPINFFDILLLYLYATIFDPDSVKYFPKEIVSLCFASANSVLSFHARRTLESIFGGPKYVITKCTNDSDQLFSFAVVLGPQNKPLDISGFQEKSENGFTNVDPILRETGGNLLIIQEFYNMFPVRYRNIDSPTYRTVLFLKLCEALGHDAFCIESERFYELTNSEQKSFLISKIRSKLNNITLNDET